MIRRRRQTEEAEDSTTTAMTDILAGTVGVGSLVTTALMLNQGDPSAATVQTPDLSAVIAEVSGDMAAHAELIKELESDLTESRGEVLQARQDAKDVAINYEQQVKDANESLAENQRELKLAEAKAREQSDKLAKFRQSRKTRVQLILDISGSMGDGIAETRETSTMLAETMPYALTSFEVGIVCHREDTVKQFPLTAISRRRDDAGKSIHSVERFLQQFDPVSGYTQLNKAVDLVLENLGEGDVGHSDVIVICSDVGPGDIDGLNQSQADAIISRLHRWANRPGSIRSVLAIYKPPTGQFVPRDEPRHREFFQAIGSVNDRSRYSNRLASMFPLTFQASFVQED